MKPLWAQTLAWLAAVVAAVLLALATPDAMRLPFDHISSDGAAAPR